MTPEFYTATEAARLLGVSEKTISKRCKAGTIPAHKGRNENNVEVWQIAAEYVNRHLDSSAVNEPEHTGAGAPEPMPEYTGTDADLNSEPIPEGMGRNHEGEAVIVPESAPERTGTELARVVASHDVQLAEIRRIVPARALAVMEEVIESNREIKAQLKASEASRAKEIQAATAEAVAAQLLPYLQQLDKVAQENAEVKAENERLRNRPIWKFWEK